MSKLVWDQTGKKYYETGVSNGVLFVKNNDGSYKKGVAWSGLTAVNEQPEGGEPTDLWADNIKYGTIYSKENLKQTIEAYTYPDEWNECDGSALLDSGVVIGQQQRAAFGLVYKTLIGNDATQEAGYRLHFVFSAKASPSERNHQTTNDNPEAETLSWSISCDEVSCEGYKSTAHMCIDSRKASKTNLEKLENKIYGTDSTEPTMPTPNEIISIMGEEVIVITSTATPGSTEVKGKSASDLQSSIVIGTDNKITGTLNAVTGYTGYSTDTDLQEGHFITLTISTNPGADKIEYEVIGGSELKKEADSNGIIVARITDKDTETLKVTATKGTDVVTKEYDLSGLTLA